MRRTVIGFLFALLTCAAIIGARAGSLTLLGAGGPSGGSGVCSQATTFIARTSGLSGGTQTNVTTLICAWVTAGLIDGDLSGTKCGTYFDGIYLLGLTSEANSQLNICGTLGTISKVGSPPWVTYGAGVGGYSGIDNAFNTYLNTSLDPTTNMTAFVRNCAAMQIWNNTGGSGTTYNPNIGQGSGGVANYIIAKGSDNNTYMNVNASAGGLFVTVSDARGLIVANRTTSTAYEMYLNASSIQSGSQASSASIAGQFNILATNDGVGTQFSSASQIMAASLGACLTPTQITNFYTPLHTFLTAEAGIAY